MTLPPTDFDAWTLETAKQVVAGKVHKWFAEVRDYMEGRHWRGSKGWVGPHVNPDLDEGDRVMTEVERGFVSVNKVEEGVNRHRDAVVGHPVTWHWAPRRFLPRGEVPTAAEATAISDLEASMARWWDEEAAFRRRWCELDIELLALDVAERQTAEALMAGRRVGDATASRLKLTVSTLLQGISELGMEALEQSLAASGG